MTQLQPNLPPESTWSAIVRLLRWDKPEGRLILMIPALWAVVLASQGRPSWILIGVIVLGALATSAAGCVVNDLWDRDIDPQVERTKLRPLASRALSVKVGVGVMLAAFACAAGLALFLNWTTFVLCVAAVPVIVLYPAMKRVFPVPQLVLAIAWGFAVLISWSMVTCAGEPALNFRCLGQPTWLLWGATLLWTLGFDTVYAMSDREDDRRIGVKSSALFFGRYVTHAVGLFYVATALVLGKLGWVMQLGWAFWVSLALATIGWLWQYWALNQVDIPRSRYNFCFRQNVWMGGLLLLGMIIGIQA
ncbi:4-hydroxybenzoate solanesyltransferase [filamentous cyanobacterium LEGE 11480]|uniref:4-hydroxybenzoate solanesyltransferase n=1 Tax=Romeriopsis navalis LEGE 11480 TaxID=2777977 RepID=A0A928Z5I5_9CYAN|nr:4-hydroxybenzoate solanesyltransferase [Romeriopsis navalis]MBE9032027.1 4-hydroxybenzoate solanesyltransferase [Romeriopsis navalis LEGE 11480]